MMERTDDDGEDACDDGQKECVQLVIVGPQFLTHSGLSGSES